MPLVVPGIQSKGGEGVEEWSNKLMGKKIGDNHDEVVCSPLSSPSQSIVQLFLLTITRQTFAKQDLPEEHRVLQPDSMSTMDFKPDRLNIHVDDKGTVQNVRYG